VARVYRLTRSRLADYIEAGAVLPAWRDSGHVFAAHDLARLELLADLADLYDMQPEALAVVMDVIDQMHAARRDRAALLAAIRAEAQEVQDRVVAVLVQAIKGPSQD
jgi:chaperone modulatory protein CbpM